MFFKASVFLAGRYLRIQLPLIDSNSDTDDVGGGQLLLCVHYLYNSVNVSGYLVVFLWAHVRHPEAESDMEIGNATKSASSEAGNRCLGQKKL